MRALRRIAQSHGLKLISDSAQAPGARYRDGYAGTFADIGGFSLNYHKHIHCGEGGILVTEDERLAQRLRLIRNHAEAVVQSDDPGELCNLLGFNFRLGEIESAIASIQLTKLAARVASRQRAADQLNAGLSGLRGLQTPVVSEGCTHVYYVYGLKVDIDLLGRAAATHRRGAARRRRPRCAVRLSESASTAPVPPQDRLRCQGFPLDLGVLLPRSEL